VPWGSFERKADSPKILAYQDYAKWAWNIMQVSALIELAAVTLFAVNLISTFARPPIVLARRLEALRPALRNPAEPHHKRGMEPVHRAESCATAGRACSTDGAQGWSKRLPATC